MGLSGYHEAIEACGAKVLVFESFGDYQGTWLAKVEYKGQVGWVEGSYGSCSGCDAFEAEFGYEDHNKTKLATFGATYLEHLLTQAEIEEYVSRNLKWDREAKFMVDFVKKHKITGKE